MLNTLLSEIHLIKSPQESLQATCLQLVLKVSSTNNCLLFLLTHTSQDETPVRSASTQDPRCIPAHTETHLLGNMLGDIMAK